MPEEKRQPIISVLGHVDSGKTTLLDKIRTSTVAAGEAGGITQQIGATQIPLDVIRDLCSQTLPEGKIQIPGLLFIDTPGHEAFTTLRKRGGSISDLAILIVDINEGFEPQTDESLTFLKDFNTPFVIAATKIDTIAGWHEKENTCFMNSYQSQRKEVRERLDNKIYELMGDLSERGFTSDRYDRVDDFQKKIGIVPVSGITGEGVPDLLSILVGLSQKFLADEIEMKDEVGKGNVLEVKETKGLGTTIDVILYEGEINKGDTLVIGGERPIVTKIRALLEPRQMKELRTEKQFRRVDNVRAAAGVKISAPGLEDAVAGSPMHVVRNEEDIETVKKELQREVEDIEIETEGEGIILKADTLGSLEGLIKILKDKEIPIRRAKIGDVTRRDVMEEKSVDDPLKRAIFAFNVDVAEQAEECKDDVKIFKDPVIYRILEEYEEWKEERKEEMKREKLEQVTRPGKLQLLPGYVFRQRKPAIVGSEVVDGVIKPGYNLVKEGKIVGKIQEIQKEGVNVDKAETGDKVAVSISKVTVGRQVEEGDVLYNALSDKDIRRLEELEEYLSKPEKRVLEEVKEKLYG
ncbi:MAG: translation initiation factor IF-2 [Candidatus Aenigmatarchaeota archaeon]